LTILGASPRGLRADFHSIISILMEKIIAGKDLAKISDAA